MQDGARNTGYLGLQVSDLSATNFANSQNYLRVGVYYYNTVSNRYRYWNGAIWHNGMSPVSLDDAYNDGNQINIGVNPVQLTSAVPNTAVLATDEGGGNNAVLFSNGNLVLGGAAMAGGNMLRVVGNALITGDMVVKGTFFSTEAETVLINDNHLYLNNGYGLNVAQTGGLVVNYLPTAITDTVNGVFTPGVGGVSNPSVVTTGAGTYAVGDLIQISGASVEENNGLYEVLSHVGTLLRIRGVGLTGTVEDFTQNQFVVDAGGVGNIVQVTVSVIRAGLAGGLWEEGQGSTTPVVFSTIAVAPGGVVTLDSAYDGGGAGLGRQITVDSRSVQLNADISTVLNTEEVFFVNVTGAEVSGTRTNGIYVFSDHTMNHANSEFQGIEVELSSMTLTNFSNLWGVSIALGALLSAGGGGEVNGIHATSDDGTVKILTNDGLITAILVDVPGSLVRLGAPTTAINVDLLVNGNTGIEITDPLTDDTHALVITRQNTVQNLGARAGSAVALNYTIGAMDVGILASSIMNEVFDNAGALGGTLSGMTLLLDGVSGSLAQKQGIRMIISGAMDSGVDDEGYFLTASQTINNGAGAFVGYYGDLQSLGLSNYGYVYGMYLLMPDDGLSIGAPIRGIEVTMPVVYGGSDMAGAEITGNGAIVQISNFSWAIDVQLGNVDIAQGQLAVNATTFFIDERIRANLNATSQEGIYLESRTNPLTAGATSFIHIEVGLNNPVAGLKVIRIYNDELPSATNAISQHTISDYHEIQSGNVASYISHYVELAGIRDMAVVDYGWYLNARHQIDDGSATYDGAYYDLTAIDAQSYDYIHGLWIGMPNDANATGQPIRGIVVAMPGAYLGGDMAGIQVDGDARQVWICNDDYAIQTLGDVYIDGKLTVTGLVDPTGVYLDEQGADLPNIVNKGVLYTKDVATITELFYRDSAGTVTQLTGGGSLVHSLQAAYNDGTTINETLALGAVVVNNAVANASNALELNRTVGTGYALAETTSDLNSGISIIQTGTIGAATVRGLYISNTETLNNAASNYRGIEINMPMVLNNAQTTYGLYINNPTDANIVNLNYGIYVVMPTVYTQYNFVKAARFEGNGMVAEICSAFGLRVILPPSTVANTGIKFESSSAITSGKYFAHINVSVGVATNAEIYGYFADLGASADSNAIIYGLRSDFGMRGTSTNTWYGCYTRIPNNAVNVTAAQTMRGFYFNVANKTLNNAAISIMGMEVDMSAANLTITSVSNFYGINVALPAAYTAGQNIIAGRFIGDGRTVEICNNTEALKLTLPATENGLYITNSSATTGIRQMIYTLQDIGNLGANNADGIRNSFTFSADSGGASVVGNRTLFTPRGNQAGHSVNHYGFRTEITPSGSITGASQFYGLQYSNGALTLNNAAIIDVGFDIVMSGVVATNYLQIFGARIFMPDDPTPVNRAIHGINITMPGAYTGSAIIGIRMTGDGNAVSLCSKGYALDAIGAWRILGGNGVIGGNLDMTGGSGLWFRPPSMTTVQRNAMTAAWGVGDAGKEWYNSTTNQWEGWNGAAIIIIG